MKIIYLHIGTEKTGTTSIQSFLSENTQLLKDQNFYVPNFLGEAHRKITGIAFNPTSSDDLFITECVNSHDLSEKNIKIELWRKEFSENFEKITTKNWIISSEFLQARIRSEDELINLRDFLYRFFDKIKIILYIRNQINAAASLWSTAVMSGLPWKDLPSPEAVSYAFDHKKTIELWRSVFEDEIDVRLFQKNDFYGGNLINDFCNSLDINLTNDFKIPEIINESIPYIAIKVLSYINIHVPYIFDNRINVRRKDISSVIANYFINREFKKFTFKRTEVNSYNHYFRESNEWVRGNYFPTRHSLFDPIIDFEESDRLDITNEYLYEIFGELISEIWVNRC